MSTKQPELPGREPTIVDTVILRYFLLVDEFEPLIAVLGRPLNVSRIVHDPEDSGGELAMSEIVRSIHVQRQRAGDPRRNEDERIRAELFASRLEVIHELVDAGFVSIADMSEPEMDMFSRLSSDEHAGEFGLAFPLDYGEAASLAIALERGWVFASDDNDALKAMMSIRPRHPYQRIRRILIEAVDLDLMTEARANAIHAEMRDFGFWDNQCPFGSEG